MNKVLSEKQNYTQTWQRLMSVSHDRATGDGLLSHHIMMIRQGIHEPAGLYFQRKDCGVGAVNMTANS